MVYSHNNASNTNLSGVSLSEVPLKDIKRTTEAKRDAEVGAMGEGLEMVGVKKGIITIMSLMIGSGIFASAGVLHAEVKSAPWALVCWFVSGCVALCGALCYAELGTAIPGSGGESQYLQRGLGEWASFMFEWASIMVVRPGSISLLMEAFSKHALMAYTAAVGAPWIADAKALNSMYWWPCKLIATSTIILITAASAISYKAADRIQGVLTYGKVISIVVIIVAGIGYMFVGRTQDTLGVTFAEPFRFNSARELAVGFIMAMNFGLWAFDGWNNLNLIAGRVRNPARTLPLSIWSSISIVIVLYMLVLMGFYAVVPANIFQKSETVGMEFGRLLLNRTGAILIGVLVMACTFGAALSSMLTSAEILIQAANKGYLPRRLGRVNPRTGTTVEGYLMQGLLAVLIVFPTGYSGLTTIVSFPTWIFYTVTVSVMLLLRVTEPNLRRPYRVWLSTPIIFLAGCMVLIATSAYAELVPVAISTGIALSGVPVYFVIKRASKSKK